MGAVPAMTRLRNERIGAAAAFVAVAGALIALVWFVGPFARLF
jgi:hypothetical protein